MELSVDSRVKELFPELTIGMVSGQIVKRRPDLEEQIAAMQGSALNALSSRFRNVEELALDPHILVWRQAYQKFGVKAKDYRPTHEALARRLIKQGQWPKINSVVDIYLANQIEHLLPHGGYDIKRLSGKIVLDICQQPEPFHPLGGGEELTSCGEVVYRDDARILTRRWNHRDCDETKITDETDSFLLFIESPCQEIGLDVVTKAVEDLASRYQRCFDGSFTFLLFSLAALGQKSR
jgi:DNA/RNA-binding domain of Phe-tRNA-synthetase-like protein